MRKKTINNLFDTFFWYALYFLPVLLFVLYIFSGVLSPEVSLSFTGFLDSVGFSIATDNVIYNNLIALFGPDGIMPLFADNSAFIIFAWFVGTFLIHLAVDFLLFIPRYCHKLLNDYGAWL